MYCKERLLAAGDLIAKDRGRREKEKRGAILEIDEAYKRLDGILSNFYYEESRNNPKINRIRLNAISRAVETYNKTLKLLKRHRIVLYDLEVRSWKLHVEIRSGQLRKKLDPDGESDLPIRNWQDERDKKKYPHYFED